MFFIIFFLFVCKDVLSVIVTCRRVFKYDSCLSKEGCYWEEGRTFAEITRGEQGPSEGCYQKPCIELDGTSVQTCEYRGTNCDWIDEEEKCIETLCETVEFRDWCLNVAKMGVGRCIWDSENGCVVKPPPKCEEKIIKDQCNWIDYCQWVGSSSSGECKNKSDIQPMTLSRRRR